jgi:hypothetical protein
MRKCCCHILIVFLTSFIVSLASLAQCPFQIQNCKGRCPRFVDMNNDGYCDYTQIIESISKKIDTMVAIQPDTNLIAHNSLADSSKFKLSSIAVEQRQKGEISKKEGEIKSEIDINGSKSKDSKSLPVVIPGTKIPVPPIKKPPIQQMKKYPFILLISISLVAYLGSHLLTKFKLLSTRIHRKIWNTILLTTFLVSAILGLFMVIQINYNFQLKYFRNILTWHVHFSIGMAMISIFHIIWHWSYLKKIFSYRLNGNGVS